MKNKYLGLISIFYFGIIIYLIISKYLKNFLVPTMHGYIMFILPFLLIMSITLIFFSKDKLKFKIGDLILLIPIIAIFLANDGKLSTNLASLKVTNFNRDVNSNKINKKQADTSKIEIIKENIKDKKDTLEEEKTFDYVITDSVYENLSNIITFNRNPKKIEGKTIKVRGFTLLTNEIFPDNTFGIGKYIVNCCTADAVFGGFIVEYMENTEIKEGSWYEIEGTLVIMKDTSNLDILVIKPSAIKNISEKDEEIYVYPCYAYDDLCSDLRKYNIDN